MKVDIQDVIAALRESESDPDAAVARLNREAEVRETEAEALRQVAAAIRLLQPVSSDTAATTDTAPSPPSGSGGPDLSKPAGIDAVRRIMREGGVWNAKALLEELQRRGWEPRYAKHPLAATEAAVSRLYRVKEEIERVGRGEYRYKGLPSSPASAQDSTKFSRGAEP